MSSNCMYILRNAKEREQLRHKLVCLARSNVCGICFEPMNDLLSTKAVKLNLGDFAFEICDSFSNNVAEILLSYEGDTINGEQAILPLFQRLQILQEVALTCVPHAERLEIYLGDNNPYLPDYSEYKLACISIADTLYKEYQMDRASPFIPCIHLIIEK